VPCKKWSLFLGDPRWQSLNRIRWDVVEKHLVFESWSVFRFIQNACFESCSVFRFIQNPYLLYLLLIAFAQRRLINFDVVDHLYIVLFSIPELHPGITVLADRA